MGHYDSCRGYLRCGCFEVCRCSALKARAVPAVKSPLGYIVQRTDRDTLRDGSCTKLFFKRADAEREIEGRRFYSRTHKSEATGPQYKIVEVFTNAR